MRTGRVVCGIITTASLVSGGAAFSGWNKKLHQDKKHQNELIKQLKQTGISEDEFVKIQTRAQAKHYVFSANQVYQKALESLELKAKFERMYLHSLDSLRNDSIKVIKTAK